MTIQFTEFPDSRSVTTNPQTRTLHFHLTGIHDDAAARAYATGASPLLFDGYFRTRMLMDPLGAGYWDVVVEYAAIPDDDSFDVSFTFDTTGATAHLTQAIEHIATHKASSVNFGNAAGDKGAIGVTENGPEGVDIVISQFSWTENWTLPLSFASFAMALFVKQVTGHINTTPFRGFGIGQVRFDGAVITASTKDVTQATGTYKFVQSDDTSNAMPTFKSGIAKKGWEYLWAKYAKEEDVTNKVIIQPPISVSIERVYDFAEFGLLGIGTGLI